EGGVVRVFRGALAQNHVGLPHRGPQPLQEIHQVSICRLPLAGKATPLWPPSPLAGEGTPAAPPSPPRGGRGERGEDSFPSPLAGEGQGEGGRFNLCCVRPSRPRSGCGSAPAACGG